MLLLRFLPLFGLVALSSCHIIFLGNDENRKSIYEMVVSQAQEVVRDNTDDGDDTVPQEEFGIDGDAFNIPEGDLDANKGCSCDKGSCKCCQKLKISKVKLKGDLCEQLTYLSQEIGLQLEVTFNGKVLLKQKVSVKNPPPICLKIPGLKKKARACIKFYDLSVSDKKLKGCSKIEVKLFKIKIESLKLGCFSIPFLENDDANLVDENLISTNGNDTMDSLNDASNNIDDANEDMPDADFEDSDMDDDDSNDNVEIPEVDIADSNGCNCDSGGCKCCQQLKISKVKLKGEVCEQFTYLPKELGIQLEVTFDGKILIKQKVSVKNPPPICLKIPGLKKKAKACIQFYNLSVSGKQFTGCSNITVKLFNINVASVDLGCFSLPFSDTSDLQDVSHLKSDNTHILLRAISMLVEKKKK